MPGMGTHGKTLRHGGTGNGNYPWPLLLIAAPAAVAIWSGWVGLGGMCGFGPVDLLPGVADGFVVNTAITLPVGIESYGAYALYAWLGSKNTSGRTRDFARKSAVGALVLGCLGQVAYHLLAAAHWDRAPWLVVVGVACLPVLTLYFAATLTHLILADHRAELSPVAEAAESAAEEVSDSAIPEPVLDAAAEPSESAVPAAPEAAPVEPLPVPAGVPEAMPPQEPSRRAQRPSKDPDAEKARKAYRESVRAGQPLSDRALAAKYGRSRTWGASRIKEVEGGPQPLAAGG